MVDGEAVALEDSFDAILQGEKIAALEAQVAELSALKGSVVMAQRPALGGVKGSAVDPRRAAFAERYLRRGLEDGRGDEAVQFVETVERDNGDLHGGSFQADA